MKMYNCFPTKNGPNIHFAYLVTIKSYLTNIPRAWMGSVSIAHEEDSRMGYWIRGHEGERNNCFSKIQLLGKKYREWKNCS